MGKSKRKDRTQKNKKTSFIDEDKAKRKMKESILKGTSEYIYMLIVILFLFLFIIIV